MLFRRGEVKETQMDSSGKTQVVLLGQRVRARVGDGEGGREGERKEGRTGQKLKRKEGRRDNATCVSGDNGPSW